MTEVDQASDEFLTRLIDGRSERLDVEQKSWIDLKNGEHRASTARHLAALANSGGGFLIFGIEDDGTYSTPHPEDLKPWSHDEVNSIVKKYLVPVFECEVRLITASVNRRKYPVVHVPAHGTVPICSKADGPKLDRKSLGISQGTYYLRAPGPESVRITTPEQWRPLIHRCVINERTSLLSSIRRLFDQPMNIDDTAPVDVLLKEGVDLWRNAQAPQGWRADPAQNHVAFAFRRVGIDNKAGDRVPIADLTRQIDLSVSAAAHEARFGWAPFQATGGASNAVIYLMKDDVEALGSDDVHNEGVYCLSPEVWRIARNGYGFSVTAYKEDSSLSERAYSAKLGLETGGPGNFFSPRLQVRQIYTYISFVRNLVSLQHQNVEIQVAVEYLGLSGRRLEESSAQYGWNGPKAEVDRRRTSLVTSPEGLIGDGTADVVTKLINKIFILFGGFQINREFVLNVIRND